MILYNKPLILFEKLKNLTTKHFLILAIFLIQGCGTTSYVYQSGSALPVPISKTVLILPPDVVISTRNAGGQLEPREEWSIEVQSALTSSIESYLYEKGVRFVPYQNEEILDDHVNALRQSAILMDAIESGARSDRVYSLSEDSISKFNSYNSNYLLITELKAERASAGRQMVSLLSAVGGIYTTTNTSTFRVGLFDLRDGQLRWFNLDPEAYTDIGNIIDADEEKWLEVTEHLMKEFPL